VLPEAIVDLEINYLKCCREAHDMTAFMPVLRAYARECGTIAELGVRKGMSTIALLSGMHGGRLWSFDRDECENAGGLETMADGAGVQWIFQLGDIYDLHPWPLKPDLLFLDADHTFEGVSRQLRFFGATTRKWVMIHDSVSFPDVRKAVLEFAGGVWEVERAYTESSGLMILERKGSL